MKTLAVRERGEVAGDESAGADETEILEPEVRRMALESGRKKRPSSSVEAEADPQAIRWLSGGEKRAEERAKSREKSWKKKRKRGIRGFPMGMDRQTGCRDSGIEDLDDRSWGTR